MRLAFSSCLLYPARVSPSPREGRETWRGRKNYFAVYWNTVFLLFIFFMFGYAYSANAQMINTIAGSGPIMFGGGGYGGDGGPATMAQFSFTAGVATDSFGNIYIADQNNLRIRKVSPAGIITTYAGTGTGGYTGDGGAATAAEIGFIIGLCIDKRGNIYLADDSNDRVRKINSAGIISNFAGNGTIGYSGDGGPATAAILRSPIDVTADSTGNIYIVDENNYRIRKVDTNGIITTIAGTGTLGDSGDGYPATAAEISPGNIAIDKSGNIYISQGGAYHNVRKINTAGIINTFAGNGISGNSGDGSPATAAELCEPGGLTVDAAGNLYIADANNGRIRKVDTAGIISTIAGTGGSGTVCGFAGDGWLADSATLCNPAFIAFDGGGNLYFSDRQNNRVRLINYWPHFMRGHIQNIIVCTASVLIDTLLPVIDSDMRPTETWSIVYNPSHGTLTASCIVTAPGDTVRPITGLSYMPAPGYTGADSFKVMVTDGYASDTTTIYVTVNPILDPGTISGTDSLCVGYSTTFSDAVAGGVWTSSNPAIATISTGTLYGLETGLDTIAYVITVSGCSSGAIFSIKVLSDSICTESASNFSSTNEREVLSVYPNPNGGEFMVSVSSNVEEELQIVVSNVVGERVREFTIMSNKPTGVQLDVPAGVYLYQ